LVGSGSKQSTRSPSLNLEHTAHSDARCFTSFSDIVIVLFVAVEIFELVVALGMFVPEFPSVVIIFEVGFVLELLPDEFGFVLMEFLLDDTILVRCVCIGRLDIDDTYVCIFANDQFTSFLPEIF
jgi:hypothetical protein